MTLYSTGRTSRSRRTPMFFIARIVAAMLIGFCGSKSTTTTESSRDSLIGESDRHEVGVFMAIAAEIHELSAAAAQHELSAAPLAGGRFFVDQEIDCLWDAVADFDVDT